MLTGWGCAGRLGAAKTAGRYRTVGPPRLTAPRDTSPAGAERVCHVRARSDDAAALKLPGPVPGWLAGEETEDDSWSSGLETCCADGGNNGNSS